MQSCVNNFTITVHVKLSSEVQYVKIQTGFGQERRSGGVH